MDKRYQVFVSSTYQDLQEERQEVMQALLEQDCIPAGMELFPAANEDQWTLIKGVIDDCDYYMVIVGGRYGSLGPEGVSYTEMEYRYALETGKPILGFLHKDPGELPVNRCEQSPDSRAKLDAFRALVKQKMCRFWDSPPDLGSKVSRSLMKLMKSNPATGWVRASAVPDDETLQDMLRLRRRIEELEALLSQSQSTAPRGSEELAQGQDNFEVEYSFQVDTPGEWEESSMTGQLQTTWDEIFAAVSPSMINEVTERDLRKGINRFIAESESDRLRKYKELRSKELSQFAVSEDDFNTIKIQLRALGLITKSSKSRSVKDTATYWTLTPYGDTVMTRLRAIRRKATP